MLSAFTNMKGSIAKLRGGADVALLLVMKLNNCGHSYLNSITTGDTLSICRKSCALGFYSFGHVITHHFGVYHKDGFFINLANGTSGFKTIMAAESSGSKPRVNFYSNPSVIYPPTGTQTGSILNNSAVTISSNRFSIAAIGDETDVCLTGFTQDCSVPNSLPCMTSMLQSRSITAKSSDDCKKVCNDRRGCDYWSFSLFSRECFIWSYNYGSFFNSLGWRSGPRSCEELTTYPCKMFMTRFTLNFQSTRATTLETCKTDCLSSPSCQSWAFKEAPSASNMFRCRLYQLWRTQYSWTSGLYGC